MPTLENTRQEAFAQARFSGMGVMEAYHAAGYVGTLPQLATKISQHPDVKARLMELHNAAGRVVAYERLDAIKNLLTIIKAKPSDAAADHPLCELRIGRTGPYHRFPSKLRAMARLVKIMGWDEPPPKTDDEDDNEEKPDRLTVILRNIRSRNRGEEDAAANHEDEFDVPAAPENTNTNTNAAAETPSPLTPRQEAFARARFNGMGVTEAYQAAGYVGSSPDRASRVNRHPPVAARLAQLRKAAEDALPYKKHEAINDLIAIVQASPEEAGPDHTLCETRMGPEGPCYRFPCKLTAMLLLVRLMGWNRPEKVEMDLGVPKMDGLDQLGVWVQARAEQEERAKARREAAMGTVIQPAP